MSRHAARAASGPAAALAVLALSACASQSGPPQPVWDTVVSDDAQFAACAEVSVTVDWRTDYRAAVSDFLDRARASGCPYVRAYVANNPAADWNKSQAYVQSRRTVSDYAHDYALPWDLQREINDPRLSVFQLRVAFFAPDDQDRAAASASAALSAAQREERAAAVAAAAADVGEIAPARDAPLSRSGTAGPFARPQGVFSSALAEICFAAAIAGRSPYDVALEKQFQPSGWIAGRYGTGDPRDQGWFGGIDPSKRVYVITRPGSDVCAVNARDGDPAALASYALGALDAVAPTPFAGDCPETYACRALPDGRVLILGLRLAGDKVPPRYRATRAENVGAARALAGAVTTEELAKLSQQIAGSRPGP